MTDTQQQIKFITTVTVSSTSNETEAIIQPSKKKQIVPRGCYVHVSTAIVGAPVLQLLKNYTVIAECLMTTGDAVGTIRYFTVIDDFTDTAFNLIETDTIKIKVGTAGTSGVIHGTIALA